MAYVDVIQIYYVTQRGGHGALQDPHLAMHLVSILKWHSEIFDN